MMKAYVRWVLKYRIAVIAATLLVTGLLGYFATGLKIVIDPVTMAPQQHPYVQATQRIADRFGSKYLMVIAVTPAQGDIFQPAVLGAVQRLTRALENTPGVVRSNMVSIAARQARAIAGSADAFEARPLLGALPLSDADKAAYMATLKAALLDNPVYMGTAVAQDFSSAAILVELKERSDGFAKMVNPVYALVDAERARAGAGLHFALGGSPVYMETTERLADRINWLFPIALLVIGLLHYEAFRTRQGFVLPLVTALMAVAWGLGLMGALKQPLDIFNSPTPILILAVAAGHAVQLLKRYYEEYEALRAAGALSPEEANRQAVLLSVAGVGPVMMIAGGVAALGFFSLMVFEIATIRTFGFFTGVGILSAVVLEMSFIPAVRSLLKPPAYDEAAPTAARPLRIWDRIPRAIAGQVIPPARRARLLLGVAACGVLCVLGLSNVHVNSDAKTFFGNGMQLQRDDAFLNRTLAGTNSLYVMVEGEQADALKQPALLQAVRSLQDYAQTLPGVGKTVSIVDYLERMNRAMHADDPAFARLPESAALVSQYLLLYSMSGEPGDFDSTIDNDFRTLKVTLLLKTGGSAQVRVILDQLQARAAQLFPKNVRLSFGGEAAQTIALSDTLIKGKLLNIAQIAAAIFIVSALAFRSLLAGLIVLAPLVCAVLAVFGVMGYCGIPMNIPNSLISAMAVGIGADYAIYLLYRMRELARLGAGVEEAVRGALATAGKAALFVATAVAGGYGVLALSWGYNVHLWLALFIIVAMVVSAGASLVLVPALVLYLKPGFVLNRPAPRSAPLQLAAVLLAGTLGLLAAAPDARAEDSALQWMQRNAAATRVKDSIASATFTLTAKDGQQRVRKTTGHTRLQDGSDDTMRLVRFQSPADIKGTAILLVEHAKADDDMWLYLPALGKVRRLAAANKKDAFVGTDFSFADVMGYKPEQWTHRITGEESVAGVPCVVIESLPADDTVKQTTGYGKRVSWIARSHAVALRIDLWDVAMQPFKRITASDVRPVAANNKWQAMRNEAENLQTGHRTTIQYDDFQADRNVPAGLFSVKELDK